MSLNFSRQQILQRIKGMVAPPDNLSRTATPHTPRPQQRQGAASSTGNLKLNRRRVTLSRSARRWSRGIVWSLVGLTGFSVIYGMVARIETSVEASGKLEPSRGVTKVSAPFAAIVREVLVKDGERVRADQPLMILRDESAGQTMASLRSNHQQVQRDLAITRQRLGLPNVNGIQLDEGALRESSIAEEETRLRQKILTYETAKAEASKQGEAAVLASLEERAAISNRTLERLIRLQRQGAVSNLQVDQERQRLLDTQMQLDKQRTLVAQAPAHAAASALRTAHVPIQEQRDLYKRLGELNHDLADVNRQLADQRQRETLLTIRAPRSGVVFDLNIGDGELASPTAPLLEVVPFEGLRARVMIPNKDVGFVKEGMPAEVRIASYPFTEYGALKGSLIRVGADSKATNPNVPAEHFPAIIQLEASSLERKGRTLPLKTGMAVTSLIKLGSRPAISMLSDRIVSLFDGVRHIR